MKLLRCKLCAGEVDIVGNEHTVNKKIRCNKCGYTNENKPEYKSPEILVIRKRPVENS